MRGAGHKSSVQWLRTSRRPHALAKASSHHTQLGATHAAPRSHLADIPCTPSGRITPITPFDSIPPGAEQRSRHLIHGHPDRRRGQHSPAPHMGQHAPRQAALRFHTSTITATRAVMAPIAKLSTARNATTTQVQPCSIHTGNPRRRIKRRCRRRNGGRRRSWCRVRNLSDTVHRARHHPR